MRTYNCGYCQKNYQTIAAARDCAESHKGARLRRIDVDEDISTRKFIYFMGVVLLIISMLLTFALWYGGRI